MNFRIHWGSGEPIHGSEGDFMSESSLEQLAQDWKGELREKNLAGRVVADCSLIRRLRAQNCPWHGMVASVPEIPSEMRSWCSRSMGVAWCCFGNLMVTGKGFWCPLLPAIVPLSHCFLGRLVSRP